MTKTIEKPGKYLLGLVFAAGLAMMLIPTVILMPICPALADADGDDDGQGVQNVQFGLEGKRPSARKEPAAGDEAFGDPSQLESNIPGDSQSDSASALITLPQALNGGLMVSPKVAALRLELGIAKAAYAAATEMPNPQFFRDEARISEGVRRTGGQKTYDPPWKIALRLLAAKQQVRQAKLDILNRLWSFRADIRRAYIELIVAQETYDALSELADLANKLASISERLEKAGSVAGLDVMKARLASAQSEIDRQQGQIRVVLARQLLNVIIGRDRDHSIAVPRLNAAGARVERLGLLPDFSREEPPLAQYLEIAMRNRLELRLIEQQIKVSQARLYLATGNIIPDPTFISGASASNNIPSGPKLKAFFVTMDVPLPIFDYSQGDIAKAKATITQLMQERDAQKNVVEGQVSSAYTRMLAARRKIDIYGKEVLMQSETVARLARRSYEVGHTGITSTLAAQQARVFMRKQYLAAVSAYEQAFADLEESIGEPLI